MQPTADAYLGGHDPRDPRASPLYADLAGLPPLLMQAGDAEILLDDSLRLASNERIQVHVWEDMLHVFPSSLGLFESAQAAHDLIPTFLRAELST